MRGSIATFAVRLRRFSTPQFDLLVAVVVYGGSLFLFERLEQTQGSFLTRRSS